MLASKILRKAAQRVQKGWCQHALDDGRGGVCVLGAMLWAAEGIADPFFRGLSLNVDLDWDRFTHIQEYLSRTLSDRNIVGWNNSRDQTAENVAQALELAAVLAEQDEQQSAANQHEAVAVTKA
jgi:hypothetical protein